MATVVTVSEFRKNLSKYLDLLKKRGNKVEIRDGRKGDLLVKLVADDKSEFDWDEYVIFVEGLGGSGLLASKKDERARKRFRNSLDKRFSKARGRQ